MASIAAEHSRLDGLIAAAGVQQLLPAIEYTPEEISAMMNINYTGVFMAATSAARQMMRYKTRGSIMLIGSMSGLVANKGLISPVYNSSKAAVIQVSRSNTCKVCHFPNASPAWPKSCDGMGQDQ